MYFIETKHHHVICTDREVRLNAALPLSALNSRVDIIRSRTAFSFHLSSYMRVDYEDAAGGLCGCVLAARLSESQSMMSLEAEGHVTRNIQEDHRDQNEETFRILFHSLQRNRDGSEWMQVEASCTTFICGSLKNENRCIRQST